eukprot:370349_1
MTVCKYEAMNVASKPPAAVYKITPQGIKNEASFLFIPVKASTVAAPPSKSMEVTMMFAMNAKTRKVICALRPQRALTISQTVCADGATFLREIASTPKRITWVVLPAAYQ